MIAFALRFPNVACLGISRSLRSRPAPLALAAVAACLSIAPAAAHEAATGWSYPFSCCSDFDCRAVSPQSVRERPEGYVIQNTGEVVAYSDRRLKNSPDGEFHWCSVKGENNSRTICLFVPPRAY